MASFQASLTAIGRMTMSQSEVYRILDDSSVMEEKKAGGKGETLWIDSAALVP